MDRPKAVRVRGAWLSCDGEPLAYGLVYFHAPTGEGVRELGEPVAVFTNGRRSVHSWPMPLGPAGEYDFTFDRPVVVSIYDQHEVLMAQQVVAPPA